MRLLNSRELYLREFLSEDEAPAYAILSHTWGSDEIKLQEWQSVSSPELESREGYHKIINCCRQAERDNIDWIWVDTCCIDKSSSAELSEAINSMFRWYREAAICYAHLSDAEDLTQIEHSRWFSRGWTLQELVAPKTVIFYSSDWHNLGTKSELSKILSDVTGIDESYLTGEDLESASVAKRMSWASQRKTSRIEDTAYCLLGIFDVNMPLIYGEGSKAFRRLQEEIMKAYPFDHTLFAWGEIVSEPASFAKDGEFIAENEYLEMSDRVLESTDNPCGLLAESPQAFRNSAVFKPSENTADFYREIETNDGTLPAIPTPLILGRGVSIVLPSVYKSSCLRCWAKPRLVSMHRMRLVPIFCYHEDRPRLTVKIPLISCGFGIYGRTKETVLDSERSVGAHTLKKHAYSYIITAQKPLLATAGDIIIKRHAQSGITLSSLAVRESINNSTVDQGLIRAGTSATGNLCGFRYKVDARRSFRIIIGRNVPQDKGGFLGKLFVGVLPVILGRELSGNTEEDGITWFHSGEFESVVPSYIHVMDQKSDSWTLDVSPLPRVSITAERTLIDDDPQRPIDILDIVLAPRDKDTPKEGGGGEIVGKSQ
ncbi:heterokaryon incompatibility protein-domain-containing protein [Xylariales sp. PMI_506]|nr:heterokaryon incompatibility protein-domain-containing protein [Xylariales sp. PMI_506]